MSGTGKEKDLVSRIVCAVLDGLEKWWINRESKLVQSMAQAYEDSRHRASKEVSDKRLRSVKLLLRNYRTFKDHAEHAVFNAEELMDENVYDIIDLMTDRTSDSDVVVESIRENVARTITIVKHVDTMLDLYEAYCTKSGNPEEMRRWQVIKTLYIDDNPGRTKELADCFGVTERTIYLDIDKACERLAALIFGIDGIRK